MFLGGFLGGTIPARGMARPCGVAQANPTAPAGARPPMVAIAAMATAASATRLTRETKIPSIA
jgi:hypothetical protein